MSHWSRPGCVIAIALIVALVTGSPPTYAQERAGSPGFPSNAELTRMLRYLVDDGETPGIILGILEADGTTRIVSYGSAGPEARPLGPESIFELGSINKTFTGTLLALMVASGEVALDDPVGKYLPDHVSVPSLGDREITLLDLATHSSGLPSTPDNHRPVDPENPWAHYTVEMLYAFLSGEELERSPGEEAEYSNIGVGLLGHVLARAAGRSYRDLLRERILEPLGMVSTGYTLEGPKAGWTAQAHAAGEVIPFWTSTEAIDGAGGLRSNVEDMLRYLRANVGPPKTDLERAMATAHRVQREFVRGLDIGLTWSIYYHDGRSFVEHGGLTGGFSSFMGFDPMNRIGFVLLTNTGRFDDDIGRDFLHFGLPLNIPEVEVNEKVLASYAGEYAYRDDRSVFIRLEDDGYLTAQTPGNARVRLFAESETVFYARRHPWRIAFDVSEGGEATGLSSTYLGTTHSGPKVSDQTPSARVVAGNAEAR